MCGKRDSYETECETSSRRSHKRGPEAAEASGGHERRRDESEGPEGDGERVLAALVH